MDIVIDILRCIGSLAFAVNGCIAAFDGGRQAEIPVWFIAAMLALPPKALGDK